MRAITSRATHLWTLVVCAVAAFAVAFLCIPTARAVEASADTFAITVGGVEFNIPGDWHEMPLDEDDLSDLDDLFADLDLDSDLYDDDYADLSDEDLDELLGDEDSDWLDLFGDEDSDWLDLLLGDDSDMIEYVGEEEEVLYTHNDGFIYIYAEPDPDFATRTVEELQESADNIEAMLDEYGINDYIDLQLQVTADLEQGYPTATMYTDNMVMNGVTYGATIKLYAVDTEDFVGSVTSILVMPTSGVTTENFGQSFPVVETDTDVTVGSLTVTVPAGCSLFDVSAFGYDAVFAYDGEGGYMFTLNIPGLDLGFSADDMTSLVMLVDLFIDPDTMDEMGMAVNGYTFNGDGALGIDLIMDMSAIGDSEVEYLGIMVVFSEGNMEILAFYEPFDSEFSNTILEPLVDAGTLTMIDMSAMADALSALGDMDITAIDDDEDAVSTLDDSDLDDIDLSDIYVIDIDESDFTDDDLDMLNDMFGDDWMDVLFGDLDEETAETDLSDLNIGHAA